MRLIKSLGKVRFELSMTRFQVVGVLSWIFLILVLPISIDLYSTYSETTSSANADTTENSQSRISTATFTEEKNLFTYTVDLEENKELISTLTFLFGTISAVIAVVSLILYIKEQKKKDTGVFVT